MVGSQRVFSKPGSGGPRPLGVPGHRESLLCLQGTLSRREHTLAFGRPRLRIFRTKSAPWLRFCLSGQQSQCCSFCLEPN